MRCTGLGVFFSDRNVRGTLEGPRDKYCTLLACDYRRYSLAPGSLHRFSHFYSVTRGPAAAARLKIRRFAPRYGAFFRLEIRDINDETIARHLPDRGFSRARQQKGGVTSNVLLDNLI